MTSDPSTFNQTRRTKKTFLFMAIAAFLCISGVRAEATSITPEMLKAAEIEAMRFADTHVNYGCGIANVSVGHKRQDGSMSWKFPMEFTPESGGSVIMQVSFDIEPIAKDIMAVSNIAISEKMDFGYEDASPGKTLSQKRIRIVK